MMRTTIMGTAAVLLLAATPASANPRGDAVQTLLGGSFFPFARAIGPKASPRCQRIADRLRGNRDDDILNTQDFQRLRRVGCQDVRPYD